jgi:hypothetical protein
MDPIAVLAAALGGALGQVANHLIDKGVREPLLEPATDQLKKWVQRGQRARESDQALRGAVAAALEQAGAPTEDDDRLTRYLKGVGLDRLEAERNGALRRQVAQAVLGCTDPAAEPPRELVEALGWPRSQARALATFLSALRGQLAAIEAWQAPIAYADRAAGLGLLRDILEELAQLDRVYVRTEAGAALRVSVVEAGLSAEDAAAVELRYRQDLGDELRWHDFRGIVQTKRDMRLPLAGRELARQRVEERRERLRAHWEDPRWHEVILLTAGQLGIVEARRYDVSDLLEDLLKMEPQDAANRGRQAVLAGRALADIDPRSVTPQTRRWVLDALRDEESVLHAGGL